MTSTRRKSLKLSPDSRTSRRTDALSGWGCGCHRCRGCRVGGFVRLAQRPDRTGGSTRASMGAEHAGLGTPRKGTKINSLALDTGNSEPKGRWFKITRAYHLTAFPSATWHYRRQRKGNFLTRGIQLEHQFIGPFLLSEASGSFLSRDSTAARTLARISCMYTLAVMFGLAWRRGAPGYL